MKTALIIIIIVLIVIIGIIISFYMLGTSLSYNMRYEKENENKNIKIIRDKSSFSDFYVENNTVYLKSSISLQNLREETTNIKIYANFDKDMKRGLLKSSELQGYNEELTISEFTLEPGENVGIPVTFIGEFAGKKQKINRLLPPIRVVEV